MNKLHEWYHLIYDCNLDMIFVTESWLNNDVPSSLLDPQNNTKRSSMTGEQVEGRSVLLGL